MWLIKGRLWISRLAAVRRVTKGEGLDNEEIERVVSGPEGETKDDKR